MGRFYKVESDGPGGATIVENATHDSRGLVVSKTAPRFATEAALPPTTLEYDVLGRQIRVTHPDGRFATTEYLPGEIILTDENGHERRKFLDAYGRVVKIEEKDWGQIFTFDFSLSVVVALFPWRGL